MQSHTGLSHTQAINAIKGMGIAEKQAVKLVCHAIAHGSYSNKGLCILYCEPEERFGIIAY